MKPSTAAALAVIAAALLALGTSVFGTPHAIVLVRHAERADQSRDTQLSPEGLARAERLAEVLGDLGLRKIYVTEYKRTQQTAQPIAQRLGITPVVIAANSATNLLQKLRRGGRDPVLVVGHSDTLPALIKQLGVSEPIEIRPSEFHHIYIVVTHLVGAPTLLRLRF